MQTGVTSVTVNISGLSAVHPDVVLIGHDRWLENSSQLPMTSHRFVSKVLSRTGWFPVGEFVLPVLVRLGSSHILWSPKGPKRGVGMAQWLERWTRD